MNSITTLAGLTLIALVGGCASSSTQPLATAGQTKQVMICAVKPDADRAAVLAIANDLSTLPNVLDVAAGYEAKTSREAPQSGETVTFILTYKNEPAMAASETSPTFERIKDDKLKPLCSDVRTYQTTLQNYQVTPVFTQETTAADLQRRAAAIKMQNELRGQTK